MNQIYNTRWKTNFVDEFKYLDLSYGDLGAGFYDIAVSAGHRIGHVLQGHQRREIKGRNHTEHTQRFVDGLEVYCGCNIFCKIPEHQRGYSAGAFNFLDGPPQLTSCLVYGFPHLLDNRFGQVFKALLHQPLQLKKISGPSRWRGFPPFPKGLLSHLNCFFNLFGG